MKTLLFFDSASTTPCCDQAAEKLSFFTNLAYGNPSSSHALGQEGARAIRESRHFFADLFRVQPEQVIFTGSGTESDNQAIYGVALAALAERLQKPNAPSTSPRILISSIEHPGVLKTAESLQSLGFEVLKIPVNSSAQIDESQFRELLTPNTILVSVLKVNNIVGAVQDIERLANIAKEKVPGVLFHSDCVQAFGRVDLPSAPSPVDLISISSHKVEGPKGVGALIVLNKSVLNPRILRPVIWGGGQEGGFRSGTQNPGLIAGFHVAAERCVKLKKQYHDHVALLQRCFKKELKSRGLIDDSTDTASKGAPFSWNSPTDAVPHIINLSIPGLPSGPFVKLLEERGCLISAGSACSSQKMQPEPVLGAMGLPAKHAQSSIRISLSSRLTEEDVQLLVKAMDDALQTMRRLLGA